jgi:hypothetical protein
VEAIELDELVGATAVVLNDSEASPEARDASTRRHMISKGWPSTRRRAVIIAWQALADSFNPDSHFESAAAAAAVAANVVRAREVS